MKTRWMVVVLISVMMLSVFSLTSCAKKHAVKKAQAGQSQNSINDGVARFSEESSILPADFFPSQVGATWHYTIEVGSVRPIEQHYSFWSMGEKGRRMVYTNKGFLFGAVLGDAGKSRKFFSLDYKVKCKAPDQGPAFSYDLGVELEILKDELQVFRGAERAFWAIANTDRFQVELVTLLDPFDAPGGGSWGSWNADGYSNRLIFFGDRPGLGLGQVIGDSSAEALVFIGPEAGMLHFRRVIDPDKADTDLADGSSDPFKTRFTEDMWYERGKGLVKLIQEYGGETSMTWNLTNCMIPQL